MILVNSTVAMFTFGLNDHGKINQVVKFDHKRKLFKRLNFTFYVPLTE